MKQKLKIDNVLTQIMNGDKSLIASVKFEHAIETEETKDDVFRIKLPKNR